MITGKQKFDHNTFELIKLQQLLFERIIFEIILVIFLKGIHKHTPEYSCDLIQLHSPTRYQRSADLFLPDAPRIQYMSYVIPYHWNRLPLELCSFLKIVNFKRLQHFWILQLTTTTIMLFSNQFLHLPIKNNSVPQFVEPSTYYHTDM